MSRVDELHNSARRQKDDSPGAFLEPRRHLGVVRNSASSFPDALRTSRSDSLAVDSVNAGTDEDGGLRLNRILDPKFKPDARQARVIEALANRSPKLAGMYRTALEILATKASLGCENARISMICHCMRELMIGLPPVMSDFSIPRPNPSSASLMKQLPRLLAAHPDADLGLDQDLVPVPRAVAQKLASLISTATKEEGRNRANTAALVTGESDAYHPAITQWSNAYQFFLSWTHLDQNHDQEKPLPTDKALLERIRVVEDVVEVRSALFFENLHAIEDLLAEINDDDEESA